MRRLTYSAKWLGLYGRMLLLALLGAATGCGASPGNGKISGRVLLDGKPLPGGTVKFRPVDGRANLVSFELDESGTFSVDLPIGEVLVAVDNREFEPKPPRPPSPVPRALNPEIRGKLNLDKARSAPPAAPTTPSKYVAIPAKYYQPESSELTFTVQPGDMTHNIELTSK
jgi:hypothetical protein